MNNKWYQSAPCKGILIVLEHILAVVMITCLVFTFSYPGDNLAGILFEKPHKKYDQSKGFTDKLMSAANDITAAEGYDSNFETEGKYDENRIVDLKEYDSDRKISNENVNGLAYRLGDLVNYWENDQEMYYADGPRWQMETMMMRSSSARRMTEPTIITMKKNFVENLKTGTFSLVIWMRQKMNIHWKAPEK